MTKTQVRVLHTITRLIIGGAQENTMFTAALLDKTRFHVEVLSGPQTGSEGSLIEEVRNRGLPLTILPELVRQMSPKNDLVALWKLRRLMQAGHFTIVHTHSSKAGVLGRIAARLAKVPIIVHTVHGWSFHDHMSPTVRAIYIFLERFAASFTDAIIVVTHRDIDKGLQQRIGRSNQYRLIRSAIPLNEFDPDTVDRAEARRSLGIPPDVPVLGNVGRFSAQKNPLDWVLVAGRVARSLPECRFLLVGDGPLRSQVENLIEKEGIAERTVLTGIRRDVAQMMIAMDVFLLTSLWEGLPRVIPQAMRMRLPVVANEVNGAAEVILPGKTGYLCHTRDINEMAVLCLELLNHPERRCAMGKHGYDFATQEFDIQKMVTQIANLYEELLHQ